MKYLFCAILFFCCQYLSGQQSNILSQAKYELSRSRYSTGLDLLNKAINELPASSEAYYLRGVVKYELDDYHGAIKDFTKAIDLNPKNQDAILYRGVSRSQIYQFKEGFEDYNTAIALNEKDWRIYANRSLGSLFLEKFVDAIADCNKVIELKKDDANTYLVRGEAKAGLEMYRVAIEDFERAMAKDSTDYQPKMHRGIARAKLKEYESALVDFNACLNMDSSQALPKYHRGLTYMDMKRHKEALADFNELLVLYPKNAAVYFNRAILYSDMKREQEALEDYTKVIQLNPKSILGYYNRGNLHFNNKRYQNALNDYNNTIELFPEFLEAHENRLKLFQAIQDVDGYNNGVKAVEKIQQDHLTSDEDLKYKQRVKLMKLTNLKANFGNRGRQAEKVQFQTVDIRLLPLFRITPFPDNNPSIQAYDGYGKPYYDMGVVTFITEEEKTTKKEILRKLRDLSSDASQQLAKQFRTGLYYSMLGNFEKAHASFDLALQLDSNHVMTYLARANLRCIELIELNEQYSQARFEMLAEEMDMVHFKLRDSIADLADADFKKVIALDSQMTYAYYNRGIMLAEAERYEQAVFNFSKAIAFSEGFVEAYYNRGLLRILLDEMDSGCSDLSLAGELGKRESYNVIKRYCE